MVDPIWREQMISHLLALYDAARLTPGLRYLPESATPEEITEARRPGLELYQALFEPRRRVRWSCRAVRRGRPSKLLEVHDGRLAVVQVARPPQQPSGWRAEQYLVVDLRLLTHEGHRGLHLHCPYCGCLHLLQARRLDKERINTAAVPEPAEASDPPADYPPLDQAAFAQVDGPMDQLDTDLARGDPEIYVSVTQWRLQRLRSQMKEDPHSLLAYPTLLGGPLVRMPGPDNSYRTRHGVYPPDPERRVWEWPPPKE